jgi:two-component system phosphate regulon response regulator PhoB|tara:strand:- start:483 stop:1184 length:702 start_codon:yes stop_codon:yes gene_type:complete
VLDSKNILVVEDDLDIRELISFNLANEGHQVFEANDGEVGIDKARNNNPDLILLDLMLPGIQGLDVCRIIKSDQETKEIPIIMVTALGQEEDIVKGLETGADDYITKPFSIKVLIARVNAVLKRSIEVGEDKSKDILINGINIKTRSREVWVNKNPINDLTFSEFQILYLLAGHPGWVFTRYQIIDKIRGDNYPVTDRSVDFQIVGLRKKLGDAGKLIKTVRGVGYRFTPDEK